MVIVSKLERIECTYNHWISLASYSLVHVTWLSKKNGYHGSGIFYYRSNDVRHLLFQSNLVNCRMNERICVVNIRGVYSFWNCTLMSVRLWNFKGFCPRINMLKGFFLKQSYDELWFLKSIFYVKNQRNLFKKNHLRISI